jgi:hypothetical protein
MSKTSLLLPVCVSEFLQAKPVQTYRYELTTPNIDAQQKAREDDSMCHVIADTVAGLYKVKSREDYAHYAKSIAPVILSKVHERVTKDEQIDFVVLASQLSQYEGDIEGRKSKPERRLARLDRLCKQVSMVYSPGARVDVVMDGLVHNSIAHRTQL